MGRFTSGLLIAAFCAVATPRLAHAQGACAADSRPDVLVVFDKSGSMDDYDRWPDATRAVGQLTANFDQRMRFGLLLFPAGNACGVAGQPHVLCGPGNAGAISATLAGNSPGGSTPLGASIDRGRGYLEGIAQRGRKQAIIAITDGEETCDADVERIAARAFAADIPVFLIAFGNGLGADDLRALDRFAAAGGTGAALNAADGDQLLQALEEIAAGLEEEVCNGIDDDCDGAIDEDFPGEGDDCASGRPGLCGPGTRVCVGGAEQCRADLEPVDELCNGFDDDCDGRTDEDRPESDADCRIQGALGPCAFGLTACLDGQVECVTDVRPAAESCNLTDDDCDGATDEGPLPEEGQVCDTAAPGQCAAGRSRCVDGELICEPDADPAAEACDGLDNDCDGALDEDTAPAFGEGLCATGLPGRCAAGQRVCSVGQWSCAPDGMAVDEVCDAVDDDCDGTIDEGLRNACGLCADAVPDEVCDGLDQDCDGQIDEQAPCPGEGQCIGGACADPCPPSGECSGGQICHSHAAGRFCVDPCAITDCPAGQACVQGVCVDPCAGVDCAAGEICRGGACGPTDCTDGGCPDGQICRAGACIDHPCDGVECPADQACRDGACVPSCATVACALDQRCEAGACVDDPCALVDCPAGQTCRDGTCGGDPCAGADCPAGQSCHDGFCIEDPCLAARCPRGERCEARGRDAVCVPDWVEAGGCEQVDCAAGEACHMVDGRPTCLPIDAEPDAGPRADVGGGGFIPGVLGDGGPTGDADPTGAEAEAVGCACDAGDDTPPPPGAITLALLLLLALRRRRRGVSS